MGYAGLLDVAKLGPDPEQTVPEPFQVSKDNLASKVVETTRELKTLGDQGNLELANVPEVLTIWKDRFSALLRMNLGAQVAQEAQACLGVLNSPEVRNLDDDVVWNLRVMLVPVYSKGINQAAVHQLYVMAVEARGQLAEVRVEPADAKLSAMWSARLRDLGLRVASTLIGMRDPLTALDHLESLYACELEADPRYAAELAALLGLVYLQLGNSLTSREWASKSETRNKDLILALCSIADGEYNSISFDFAGMEEESARGMALLYAGEVDQAREVLEKQVLKEDTPTAVLYSLFQLYDLQPETARLKKTEIARDLAKEGRTFANYDLFSNLA